MTTQEVRQLDADELHAWRSLIHTTTGLLAMLDNELQAEHGLALGDYEVLFRLSEAPDHSLRMSDLAGRLRLSPSGITRRIDGLVRAGLVERRQCQSDRRGSYATLTVHGLDTFAAVSPTHVRGVREHFVDRLSKDQLRELAAALAMVEIDEANAAGGCDTH